jgi:hypothetical protein
MAMAANIARTRRRILGDPVDIREAQAVIDRAKLVKAVMECLSELGFARELAHGVVGRSSQGLESALTEPGAFIVTARVSNRSMIFSAA